MNEIEKSRITELSEIHEKIGNHIKMTLYEAIRAGQILSEQKEGMKHGEFTPWVNDNLSFDIRTAQRYMRAYNNRERIEEGVKSDSVSFLTDAYRLLEEPKETIPEWFKRTFLPPPDGEAEINNLDDARKHLNGMLDFWEKLFWAYSDNGNDPERLEKLNLCHKQIYEIAFIFAETTLNLRMAQGEMSLKEK